MLFRFTGSYAGFHDWVTDKKTPRIKQHECGKHAASLVKFVSKRTIHIPATWKDDILELSSTLSAYETYLAAMNEQQKMHHESDVPIRQLADHIGGQTFQSVEKSNVKQSLQKLSNIMKSKKYFEHMLIDDDCFSTTLTSLQRHNALKDISLEVSVQVLHYDAGGGHRVILFIQRIPEVMSDHEKSNALLRFLATIQPLLPVYHTRAMRRAFMDQVNLLTTGNVPPHVSKNLYQSLTGDSSAEITSEIAERVQLAIDTNDPDLIMDLRHLNSGRPGDTFKVFFDELIKYVDEITAADERRHGVAHMSEFLSLRDMIDQVSKRVPENTPIPSASTVGFAFCPPNMAANSSLNYTGKIQLKHSIQRRQLRANHVDAHYNLAQQKYMKEMAVKERDTAIFLSCDDKATIDYGEPGHLLSTGVRGRTSITPSSSLLGALDHDVKKRGHIIPSVILNVDIPEDISESFYRGQVSVSLKDSVFNPSNCFRTVDEMIHVVLESCSEKDLNDLKSLFLMTDGGSEHKVTYHSVKIALIAAFKKLRLDRLIAMRCAPNQSYTNIVERMMSLLNICYQNIALERDETEKEDIIKKCKTLGELRSKTHLKPDWEQSVQNIITTLGSRTERMALKDIPFKTFKSSEMELENFINTTALIDPSLPTKIASKKLAKTDLTHAEKYHEFLRTHCNEGEYAFQIRRCCDVNCCPGEVLSELPKWLPTPIPDDSKPGHYKKLSAVLGNEPTDAWVPSIKYGPPKFDEKEQGCAATVLSSQNLRKTVQCSSCRRPRGIYCTRKLLNREVVELNRIISEYDYMCGSHVIPDDSFLKGELFTRVAMTCHSPMEWQYYSYSNAIKDRCSHCATLGGVIDPEVKKEYKHVLPMCSACKSSGKEHMKRAPFKHKGQTTVTAGGKKSKK